MAELLLEIVEGQGAATQIPLTTAIELGRDPALPNALDDSQVSRRHARISPSGGGATIEDLGSTNGTYVNDQPVQGTQQLNPGDRVRVGLTVLELRTREEAAARGSAVSPMPRLTRVGAEVLRPASGAELAPVRADQADVPGLMTEESEPAFIQASAVGVGLGNQGAGSPPPPAGPQDPDVIARLIDTRVKRQTGIAAFALLAAAALAVAIFFGVR
jgi:pSer/pThr/pTyr-binding forkhead associated (FHA) protein